MVMGYSIILLPISIFGTAFGLVSLWFAGDFVVRYAVEIAKKANVTKFFIGFIVLALAAGIPELAVAITAAFSDVTQLAVGDIIGANFSDITFVCGLVLIIAGPITIKKSDRLKLARMLIATLLVLIVIFYIGTVTKLCGGILVCIYFVALYVFRKKDKNDILQENIETITEDIKNDKDIILTSMFGLIVKLIVSISAVLICSWFSVNCIINFAHMCGMSLETAGTTICAIGTSLPEIAMSLTAIRRKEYDLAFGPTLGSTLEHSTLVLGILGLCSKYSINFAELQISFIFMLVAFTIICFSLLKFEKLTKLLGVILITIFVLHILHKIHAINIGFI